MKNDVIIVGAGLGGLAAAAYLARAGKRVTVYERSRELGGRARTRRESGERATGEFAFNLGAHAFYAGGAGMRVMRELGIEPRGAAPPTAGALAVMGGRLARLPTGMMSLLTTDLFDWSAKLEAGKLLATFARLDTTALDGISVAEWLKAVTPRREVRAYVEAAVRVATYANAPELMSAGAAIAQIKLATKPGVLYLDGGWGALVDALARVARANGARIVCGAAIKTVAHDDRVHGVVLESGELVAADHVIVASSPTVLCALVRGGRDASARAYADASLPLHAACLDVALRELPVPSRRFALGVDVPLYFSVHSATAKVAPDGAALVHTMKYLDPRVPSDAKRDEAELEALLDLVQPGWRAHVVHRAWLPSMTVSNALVAAANGAKRPPTALPDVAGVHVVGDWLGNEGMLADATLASARDAAHAIIAEDAAPRTAREPLRLARAG